jgi:predicted metal-dependent hydrolase
MLNVRVEKRRVINNGVRNIRIFGEEYLTKIIYINTKNIETNISKKNIEIYIPLKYKNIKVNKIISLVEQKIYDQIAEKEIESIMEKTRIMLKGLAPEDYKIQRLQNGKLAKYSEIDRTIIISPEIIRYRKNILEYTVLYEFCHLKYKKRVKGFKEMLEKYMPEYENYEFVNICI